jgi:hypothetical protein
MHRFLFDGTAEHPEKRWLAWIYAVASGAAAAAAASAAAVAAENAGLAREIVE